MTADNSGRAEWARAAVLAFRNVCHGSMNADGTPDYAEAVGDLIADLMHLCDGMGIDPMERVRNGVSHFVCEKLDQPDGLGYETEIDLTVGVRQYHSGAPYRPFVWRPGGDFAAKFWDAREQGNAEIAFTMPASRRRWRRTGPDGLCGSPTGNKEVSAQ